MKQERGAGRDLQYNNVLARDGCHSYIFCSATLGAYENRLFK